MDPKGDRKEISGDDRTTRQGIGRGRDRWLRDNVELRRPHSTVSTQYQPSAGVVEHSLQEKKSSLSPQAAEFVPRSLRATQSPLAQFPLQPDAFSPSVPQLMRQYPKSSVQNRINIARETPPSYVMENTLEDSLQQQCNIQESEMGYNKYTDDQDNLNDCKKEDDKQDEDIYYLESQELFNIINILIVNPAEFTNLIPPFVNRLRWDKNTRHLEMVIKTIIEWSIAESNFRYNGARFCKYFDNISEEPSKELFRDVLCLECKLETRLQEQEWLNQIEEKRDPRRCNGLILFLAELVAQMDESYAFSLGELLVWFITRVLRRPASTSVKYICQALKLAGHVLEKDKSKSEDMENMMRALTELVNNGQVDTHVGNMVNSVHKLRKDWEKSAFNCDSTGTSNTLLNEVQQQSDQPGASSYNSSGIVSALLGERQQSLDQPVMYGPDGEILSAEESQFLQDHIRSDLDDIGTSEEGSVDENYDDEIAIAYEEFLKDTPK